MNNRNINTKGEYIPGLYAPTANRQKSMFTIKIKFSDNPNMVPFHSHKQDKRVIHGRYVSDHKYSYERMQAIVTRYNERIEKAILLDNTNDVIIQSYGMYGAQGLINEIPVFHRLPDGGNVYLGIEQPATEEYNPNQKPEKMLEIGSVVNGEYGLITAQKGLGIPTKLPVNEFLPPTPYPQNKLR